MAKKSRKPGEPEDVPTGNLVEADPQREQDEATAATLPIAAAGTPAAEQAAPADQASPTAAPAAQIGEQSAEGDAGAGEASEHFDIGQDGATAAAAAEFDQEEEPKTLAEASDAYLARVKQDMEEAGTRGTGHPLYKEICDELARRAAAQDKTAAVPSELGKVVDCGHNPIPLGQAAHEVDCGHNPGKAGHPHKVIFREDGSASVHDAKGQAIHHGTHRSAVEALEAAGVDWKTLPTISGKPVEREGDGEGN